MTSLDELEKLAGDALPHWGKNALPMLGGNPNAIDKTAPFVNAANPETILLLCRVARAAREFMERGVNYHEGDGGRRSYAMRNDFANLYQALRTVLAEMGEA